MYRTCAENYKIHKRKNKDLNKWRDLWCSWTGRRNIVKTSILLKLISRFNTILTKFQQEFLQKEARLF